MPTAAVRPEMFEVNARKPSDNGKAYVDNWQYIGDTPESQNFKYENGEPETLFQAIPKSVADHLNLRMKDRMDQLEKDFNSAVTALITGAATKAVTDADTKATTAVKNGLATASNSAVADAIMVLKTAMPNVTVPRIDVNPTEVCYSMASIVTSNLNQSNQGTTNQYQSNQNIANQYSQGNVTNSLDKQGVSVTNLVPTNLTPVATYALLSKMFVTFANTFSNTFAKTFTDTLNASVTTLIKNRTDLKAKEDAAKGYNNKTGSQFS